MKWKAAIILTIIVAVTVGAVFLLLYGFSRDDKAIKVAMLPSNDVAKQYIMDNKLLTGIRELRTARVGGPAFMMATGTDDQGNEKIVWLTGEKLDSIKMYGSSLIKDGIPKQQIIEKAKEKGVMPDQIKDMFVAPYDYTSQKLVWFILEKGDRQHMLWYDFQTGDPVWEAYQEPTSWSLKKTE